MRADQRLHLARGEPGQRPADGPPISLAKAMALDLNTFLDNEEPDPVAVVARKGEGDSVWFHGGCHHFQLHAKRA